MADLDPTGGATGAASAPAPGAAGRPLPPGARVLTLEEIRDGVRLETGREHVLVVPAPVLVVEGPASVPTPPAGPTAIVSQKGAPKSLSPEPGPKTLWITHVGASSTPTMPELVGFRARVAGVSPDPTPGLTFEWTLTLDYWTLARDTVDKRGKRDNRRVYMQVVYKVTGRGGVLPPDALQRAPGTVARVVRPDKPRPGPPGPPTAAVAGGRLTIDAATELPSVGRVAGRLTGYSVLAWDNPTRAAMRAYLTTLTDSTEAAWLADVFCAETQLMQFSHRTVSQYRRAFHPVSQSGGDGGIGLGQVTHWESLTPHETWDWRANARTALTIYQTTRGAAERYVKAVRKVLDPPAGDSRSSAVRELVAYRRRAGMPPLARVDVPDFTAQQLREDQARGYNGFRASNDPDRQPQFGKNFHEFRLRTEGTPPRVYVENERTGGGERIASAVWVRVPDEERPRGPELSRYIEQHVLKPNCP